MRVPTAVTDSSLLQLPVHHLAGRGSYVLGCALLVAGWWLASALVEVRTFLPSPWEAARTFVGLLQSGALLQHVGTSVARVLAGFVLGGAVAIPLGAMIGLLPSVQRAVEPLVELIRPVPPYAMIPLALLWFGTGAAGKLLIITYAVLFPVLLNTVQGVSAVDRRLVDAARTLGARRRFIVTRVILPAARPQVLVGLRVGFGSAWLALVAAEMVASSAGLGFLIIDAREMLRTDVVVVCMVVIGVIGYGFNGLFLALQARIEKG